MADIVEVTDTNQFQSTLDSIAAEQEFVVVIFTGTVDPATGKNWCPDCERAKPNLNNILMPNASGKVIKCIVQRSEWRGNPDHPYKKSSFLKVRGVPTVVLIREGDIIMRADKDEDFDNEELLLSIAKPE